MRLAQMPDEVAVLREPMLWLGPSAGLAAASDPLPIALLDPPCGFRNAALAALEVAGKAYRVAATSPSLSGLRAAVRGGIALTVRTAQWIGPDIARAPASYGLPNLPRSEFSIRLRGDAMGPAADFARLLSDALQASRAVGDGRHRSRG